MFGGFFWLFCSHLLYTQVNIPLHETAIAQVSEQEMWSPKGRTTEKKGLERIPEQRYKPSVLETQDR